MVVLGDLRAVGPAEWEDIATYQVADDATCVPLIEGFLGITGPRRSGGATRSSPIYPAPV